MNTTTEKLFINAVEKQLGKARITMVLERSPYNDKLFISGVPDGSLTPTGQVAVSTSHGAVAVDSGRTRISRWFQSSPNMRLEDTVDATVAHIVEACREQKRNR
ncbi:MAG: hypothetical protein ACWGQW_02310 [bacterium]